MKHTLTRLPALLLMAAAVFAFAGSAGAEVRDEAGYFSPEAERQAAQLLQQIREKHKKDVVIETVSALPGAPQEKQAREDFFQSEVSRRGQAAGVDGIYVLISRNPSSLYAGIDPKTQQRAFTLTDRGRLRDVLVQHFSQKDFDNGLLAGLRMIDQTMATNASGAGGSAGVAGAGAAGAGAAAAAGAGTVNRDSGAGTSGQPQGSESGSGSPAPNPAKRGFSLGTLLCLGVGALVVFMLVRGLMRSRQQAAGAGYGARGMGQPGMGQPGYDPRYPQQQGMGMGQGGGMGRGLLGGLLGGVAGGYLYDKMSGGAGGNEAQAAQPFDPNSGAIDQSPDATSGFGDFGGGDMGGGGDFGGGDFGGGDSGGGGGDF